MKPPAFEYTRPASIDEALGLLGAHGFDAKVLAGGQSLVPLMNFRLARPAQLIDINGIAELDYVREGSNELFKFNNPNVKSQCGCGESIGF